MLYSPNNEPGAPNKNQAVGANLVFALCGHDTEQGEHKVRPYNLVATDFRPSVPDTDPGPVMEAVRLRTRSCPSSN